MVSGDELEQLCTDLKASDRRAFERIFRSHRDELLRYVHSIVSDGTVAHDLVQDVFLSLWGLRTSLDPTQSLKAYLYRMARNRAYRYLRDERLHTRKHAMILETSSNDSGTPHSDHQLDEGIISEQLRKWVDELPERQREALILSRYHELSHKEIASIMGVSPRTVNNHIMRALEYLQKRIHRFEPSLLLT